MAKRKQTTLVAKQARAKKQHLIPNEAFVWREVQRLLKCFGCVFLSDAPPTLPTEPSILIIDDALGVFSDKDGLVFDTEPSRVWPHWLPVERRDILTDLERGRLASFFWVKARTMENLHEMYLASLITSDPWEEKLVKQLHIPHTIPSSSMLMCSLVYSNETCKLRLVWGLCSHGLELAQKCVMHLGVGISLTFCGNCMKSVTLHTTLTAIVEELELLRLCKNVELNELRCIVENVRAQRLRCALLNEVHTVFDYCGSWRQSKSAPWLDINRLVQRALPDFCSELCELVVTYATPTIHRSNQGLNCPITKIAKIRQDPAVLIPGFRANSRPCSWSMRPGKDLCEYEMMTELLVGFNLPPYTKVDMLSELLDVLPENANSVTLRHPIVYKPMSTERTDVSLPEVLLYNTVMMSFQCNRLADVVYFNHKPLWRLDDTSLEALQSMLDNKLREHDTLKTDVEKLLFGCILSHYNYVGEMYLRTVFYANERDYPQAGECLNAFLAAYQRGLVNHVQLTNFEPGDYCANWYNRVGFSHRERCFYLS